MVRHNERGYNVDEFYEQALTEYQEGKYNKAAYAKAVVETEGNEKLLLPAYIRVRTRQLEAEIERVVQEQQLKIQKLKEEEISKKALIENRALSVSDYKIFSLFEINEALALEALYRQNRNIRDEFDIYNNSSNALKASLDKLAKKYTDSDISKKLQNKIFYPGERVSLLKECLSRKLYIENYFGYCNLFCSKCKRDLIEKEEIICTSCGKVDHVVLK